jgi:hypothetical protein
MLFQPASRSSLRLLVSAAAVFLSLSSMTTRMKVAAANVSVGGSAWSIELDAPEYPSLFFEPAGPDRETSFQFQYTYSGEVVNDQKYFSISLLEHDCVWVPLNKPDALYVTNMSTNNSNQKLRFQVMVDPEQISESSYYTDNGDDNTATIAYCVRVDYRTPTQVINFKEVQVNLHIRYEMMSGFMISGILMDEPMTGSTASPTSAPVLSPTTAPSSQDDAIIVEDTPPDIPSPYDDDDYSLNDDDIGLLILLGGGVITIASLLGCVWLVLVLRRNRKKLQEAEQEQSNNVVRVQINKRQSSLTDRSSTADLFYDEESGPITTTDGTPTSSISSAAPLSTSKGTKVKRTSKVIKVKKQSSTKG